MFCCKFLSHTGIISNASQSLFTYDEDSFEEFFDPSFTPAFEPVFDDPAVEYLANEMCGGDVFCLFDVAATGDIDIGLETLMSGQEFVAIGNVSQPCEQNMHGCACKHYCNRVGTCICVYCFHYIYTCSHVHKRPFSSVASVTCTPSCINGACIDGNVCACSAGYNGDRCDQPGMVQYST